MPKSRTTRPTTQSSLLFWYGLIGAVALVISFMVWQRMMQAQSGQTLGETVQEQPSQFANLETGPATLRPAKPAPATR